MQLPVDSLLPDILRSLAQQSSLVLQAPPGTGKTTRVPLALLGADFLGDKRIVMLEPRRLAARSAARFMASLLGEDVGRTVGYRTRLDTKVGPATKIEVVTEGILTRLLQADATLSDYGVVIFDEFHERSLQADLGLALVRECQQVLRDDLRLIVMSATLDAAAMSRVLGEVPVLSCTGQVFPVELRYRPMGKERLPDFVAAVIRDVVAHEAGSLLVFLPGEGEIRRVTEALQEHLPADVMLAPLYGQLSADEQDKAISPAAEGVRKVVLATSIAETSLTIEGIRVVIDAGLLRVPQYDPNSAMTRLVTQRVSAANAEQRRGRAGRVCPGICVRLWSEDEQQRLMPFAPPEILQADLTGTVLELAQWGAGDPAHLSWLDMPPAANWTQARELLQQLEALDSKGHVTAHGRNMIRLGLPPRLSHMVLRGRERGLGRLAAELAALLSERDLLPHEHGADIHDRLALLRGEQEFARVDRGRLRLVREGARRLDERSAKNSAEKNGDAGLLMALAYPDHVGQRRAGGEARFRLSNGSGAFLPAEDRLAREEWIVAAELDGKAREARVFLAAPVSLAALEEVLPAAISSTEFVSWDAATQAVLARKQKRLGALVLEDRALATADPEKIRVVLCAAMRDAGLEVLPWTPALRQWQARVALMHGLEPAQWPDVSDAALLATMEHWAGPYLDGVSRFSHLQKFPLADALHGLLDWNAQQQLDRDLPVQLSVPTGSSISIDYTAEHGPVLAVKLQEMFGQLSTPVLANGRVPLTVHLLSPAQRPVAVTQDLASFWKNAYADVRRDLRGRYPRHPWPEDPFTAVAQRGVKHPRK
ncbi:MAG: ATP-dependent helicase HrpB [bacterium]|nr:ATP-dependent helicase HrpB [bacterium]